MELPTIDMIATGKNIKKIRQKKGFTVKDIQTVFGFASPQAIYKWQAGQSLPTIDNLVVLAALFGVPIDQIIITIMQHEYCDGLDKI